MVVVGNNNNQINLNNMQITAKLIQLLPLQTGKSTKGEWKKQDIIVETEEEYSRKVCVSIWGDKIDSSQLQVGNKLIIDFNIESREFNERWYTDVKAWRIETIDSDKESSKDEDLNDFIDKNEEIFPF